jgi:hypothetical protein
VLRSNYTDQDGLPRAVIRPFEAQEAVLAVVTVFLAGFSLIAFERRDVGV